MDWVPGELSGIYLIHLNRPNCSHFSMKSNLPSCPYAWGPTWLYLSFSPLSRIRLSVKKGTNYGNYQSINRSWCYIAVSRISSMSTVEIVRGPVTRPVPIACTVERLVAAAAVVVVVVQNPFNLPPLCAKSPVTKYNYIPNNAHNPQKDLQRASGITMG